MTTREVGRAVVTAQHRLPPEKDQRVRDLIEEVTRKVCDELGGFWAEPKNQKAMEDDSVDFYLEVVIPAFLRARTKSGDAQDDSLVGEDT